MLRHDDYRVESYQDFRERAKNPALSANEKCGFPEVFRSRRSESIFADISSKLTALAKPGAKVLDIGLGCSDLAHYIVEATGQNGQSLTAIDSPEMLGLLPDKPHLTKIGGCFPQCTTTHAQPLGPFDAILAYSVAQYVFAESNLCAFVDSAVHLMNEQGQFLIGDIPNAAMRERFMASAAGKAYHRNYYSHLPEPEIVFNVAEPGEIDDDVILGLIARMRAAGLHAFVLPQAPDLPMANRREDVLILRP